VKLLLPWSHLVSDNARYGVINGKLLLTKDYRRCKGLTRELARAKLGQVEPASIPLQLEARVWVPDEMRARRMTTPRCAYRGCRRSADATRAERALLCWIHDVELYELVLMFVGDRQARRKSAALAARWVRKVNARKAKRAA
jgi:hypothetical protein